MKENIFIDCGFHHGEGLKHFVEKLNIYTTGWTIIAFEPNPACRAKQRLRRETDYDPKIFVWESAVWIKDGYVAFRQENHMISKSGSPTDGTSVVDGWASQVADVNGQWPGLSEIPIEVPCIDFSKFLGQFPEDRFNVFCKMDIEGSEFAVLRKCLNDGTAKIMKRLWIEFHERFVPGEDAQTKAELIDQLKQYTNVELWH